MVGSPPGVNSQLNQLNAEMLARSTKKSRLVHQVLNAMGMALGLYFYCIFSFIFGGAIDELNSQSNYVVRCGCGWCTDLLIIALPRKQFAVKEIE